MLPEDAISGKCEGALQAGRLVVYGTTRDEQIAEMAALPAVDVDAIATAAVIGSAAAAQSIGAGVFDGVIGFDRIAPCRTVVVVFDANADWDTPSGECRVDIYGHDAFGAEIKDTVSRANVGAVQQTIATEHAFASVNRIDIEACNGATGTATVGVNNDKVELSQYDYPGLAIYRAGKQPNTALRNFADGEDVSVMVKGRMFAVPEHDVTSGDQVYVRVLEAGNDLRGQLTGQDGAATPATYAKLAGAKWRHAGVADAFSIVELAGV